MRHIREVRDIDGRVYREIVSRTFEKTSWDKAGEFTEGLNQGIGRSLSPISFKGGFSVSTSWLLFGLLCLTYTEPIASLVVGTAWLLSLFTQFR